MHVRSIPFEYSLLFESINLLCWFISWVVKTQFLIFRVEQEKIQVSPRNTVRLSQSWFNNPFSSTWFFLYFLTIAQTTFFPRFGLSRMNPIFFCRRKKLSENFPYMIFYNCGLSWLNPSIDQHGQIAKKSGFPQGYLSGARHSSTRGECLPFREGSVMVWGWVCFTNIERGSSTRAHHYSAKRRSRSRRQRAWRWSRSVASTLFHLFVSLFIVLCAYFFAFLRWNYKTCFVPNFEVFQPANQLNIYVRTHTSRQKWRRLWHISYNHWTWHQSPSLSETLPHKIYHRDTPLRLLRVCHHHGQQSQRCDGHLMIPWHSPLCTFLMTLVKSSGRAATSG